MKRFFKPGVVKDCQSYVAIDLPSCDLKRRQDKFILLFRTGSSKVVNECQVSFGFLPSKSHILIRTASFLHKFAASENSLCMLFANDAHRQLDNIFYTIW